jgi:hypothetical protein
MIIVRMFCGCHCPLARGEPSIGGRSALSNTRHPPRQPQQLGSLGIGQARPQRPQLQRQFIALGPALDPSPTRIIVFRGDFGGNSSPSSPILRPLNQGLFLLVRLYRT